ncbi:MAG: hypothetical protein M5U26_06090 [Planctomycetota bacterium]|nr:hypothetical protein [Planctomycetota bacterium]
MTSARAYAVAWLVLLACAGCKETYDITLKPEGEKVRRRLLFQAENRNLSGGYVKCAPSAEQIQMLQAAYGKEGRSLKDRPRFEMDLSGLFKNEAQGDGAYRRFDSTMGYFASYVEDLQGKEDLSVSWERKRVALDHLADLILLWFRQELGETPQWAKLQTFLDKDLRADLKEIFMQLWLAEEVSERRREAREHTVARVVLRLASKDYFKIDQLPAALRAVQDRVPSRGHSLLMGMLQETVVRKMGLDPTEALPDALRFLSSTAAAEASFNASVVPTQEFQALALSLAKQLGADQNAKPGIPTQESLLSVGIALWLLLGDIQGVFTSKHYNVRLECPIEPLVSNGRWEPKEHQITWLEGDEKTDLVRRFCHATWAVPDEAYQQARFGKTVLRGTELVQYVLWRRGLRDVAGAEWDALLDACVGLPAKDIKGKLQTFRFSEQARAEDPAFENGLTAKPIEWISTGLDRKE